MKTTDPRRRRFHTFLEKVGKPIIEAGYQPYGDTFNRESEPKLTQVVNVQLSKYADEFKIAINLGIYVDEVAEVLGWPRASEPPVEESQCQFRIRLSTLVASKDIWSDLSEESADEIKRLLQDRGLPFLERWSTRRKILEDWAQRRDESFWRSWASPLVMGVLLAKYGDRDQAYRLLKAQYEESRGTPGAKIVEQTTQKLGFPLGAG